MSTDTKNRSLDFLMEVPLKVTVELGRKKMIPLSCSTCPKAPCGAAEQNSTYWSTTSTVARGEARYR